MKILFLADSNSPHTIRWVNSLSNSGYSISIFTLHTPDGNLYRDNTSVTIYSLNAGRYLQTRKETEIRKLIYLKSVGKVKKLIKKIKPDILHSHYASSYGLIGALTGFHPFIISLWGGDIFRFPNYSFLNKNILKFNLSKADKLLSTSQVMKLEAVKYTNKDIEVIPFGIDTERFHPNKTVSKFNSNDIVIGCVKALEPNYGIDVLINAFKLVKQKITDKSLKLMIVGKGSYKEVYEKLAEDLDLGKDILFTGFVEHNRVQEFHNMLDIFVAMSIQESFGVAILEASACSKPVIVSNVGGLREVVDDGKTGFLIESKNYKALAEKLIKLINNTELRHEMGRNGRNKVLSEYDWNDSVKKMITIYESLVN